jgi:hypothetical protein
MNGQPNWAHLWDAFVAGAQEARANPDAGVKDFNRAADAYCKRLLMDLPDVDSLMAMSEAEIDSELSSLGIDPATAAQKGAEAVAAGIAKAQAGGYVCGMCGRDTPHQHTPEEVTIFRNGIKRFRTTGVKGCALVGRGGCDCTGLCQLVKDSYAAAGMKGLEQC